MDGRRWSDLPADALREISSRVCAAAGFVSFHAVCKSWRASRDPLARRTTTSQFVPWLLAPPCNDSTQLRFRCIFSKSSYHARSLWPPAEVARNWVSSADGTKVRYLTVENLRPSLDDPLTGEVTDLPPFPDHISRWTEENPCGVIYGDGTTFLYNLCYPDPTDFYYRARFRAALLPTGRDEWIVVERTLTVVKLEEFYAVYHRGKIMFTVDDNFWHIVTPDGGDDAGDLIVYRAMSPREFRSHDCSYVVESRGVLLWASVQVESYYSHRSDDYAKYSISMSIYALEEEEGEEMRWVKKDGHSVADRVLFLGTPNSYAIDSSRLGGDNGGCAYFVYHNANASPREKGGVFRCNLISNKVKFLERLPQGWNDRGCTWHVLQQPEIAPIQVKNNKTPQIDLL
jgi:hypothetical protein